MNDKSDSAAQGESPPQGLLFDKVFFGPRFLDRLVGKKLLNEPRISVVELVANSWDSGATRVDITWPNDFNEAFAICDNGEGMTEDEFLRRWNTMAYNRLQEQGRTVPITGKPGIPPRTVYGRNGIGRFAAFCFGDQYTINTKKDGNAISYLVSRSEQNEQPFNKERLSTGTAKKSGTTIRVDNCRRLRLSEEDLKAEIAMRFLADPSFLISVNGSPITLRSIPNRHIEKKKVEIENVGTIFITIIDVSRTDRTSQQHGIAFHVNNRLVGNISWKQPGISEPVDGRSIGGKRLLFIVNADILHDREAIKEDWSGFYDDNADYLAIAAKVQEVIDEQLDSLSEEEREDLLRTARRQSMRSLRHMPISGIKKWTEFVVLAQTECRSLQRSELIKLAQLLANLEAPNSKYSLISRLAEQQPGQLDKLDRLLADWSIDTAKIVLDEIRSRITLIAQLEHKVDNTTTDEVQELQPLFEKGLWIFGPEYETIHFTSNQQMNTVIRKLLRKPEIAGSLNRPDFVVVQDGSLGCYSYPRFGQISDGDAGERGIGKLVILELKKPGVKISSKEKEQAWKYVRELLQNGLIDERTPVECFVIGNAIDPTDASVRKEGEFCRISPMLFRDVLTRARSRLHNLYEEVKGAPFFQEVISEYEALEESIKREDDGLFELDEEESIGSH